MNIKLIGIFVCVLLIATAVLPVSGFTIDTYESGLIHWYYPYEDYPAYMTTPYPEFNIPDMLQVDSKHQKIMLPLIDNNITDMIQQLDESMVLRYVENLTDFGPRVTGTSECYAAGDYIYNEFESMGLEVSFHNWSYSSHTDRNIEATLYGTNGQADGIYIICAHYDSVFDSPGADDDGSGVAAVMSAAYIMSQYEFDHTIRFVIFSGEEQGLYGSYKYVEKAYGNGDNITGVLNVDMMGYAETTEGGNKVTIRQNEASIWLTNFIAGVSQLYHEYINLEIIPALEPSGYSDHFRFWQFGYDAVQYRESETNPYYHTPEDTIEHMNISYAVKVSKLSLATLAELSELTPDLSCEGSLSWTDIKSDDVATGSFAVENVGEPASELDWEIESHPDWGAWTFTLLNGDDLTPENGSITVDIEVVAPDDPNAEFTGEIKIVNSENSSDYCIIDVSLVTPKNQQNSHPLFQRFIDRFPNAFPILRQIFGLQ